MKNTVYIAALSGLWWTTACSMSAINGTDNPPCRNDSECAESQVCFPDGCAEPDTNIVMEITPTVEDSHAPHEFMVETLGAEQDLLIPAQPYLQGTVTRRPSSSSAPLPYELPMSAKVSADSELIAGLVRSNQVTFTPDALNAGTYRIAVGVGQHTAVVTTQQDTTVPPVWAGPIAVSAGQSSTMNIELAAPDTVRVLTGVLRRTVNGTPAAPGVPMSVQALDITEERALSQRVTALENDGTFTLYVSPEVSGQDRFLIRAAPEKESMVPEKIFELQVATAFTGTATLTLGEYGTPVSVTGVVTATNGQPIFGALVYLEGTVRGGGTFRSMSQVTNSYGVFSLQTLPSDGTSFVLWAVPPANSGAGILSIPAEVTATGSLVSQPLVCPDRLAVSGTVVSPDGSAAPGVKVMAHPLEAIDAKPLPTFVGEAITDQDGRFQLALDAATYRFEFRPPPSKPALPRISRLINVTVPNGDPLYLELPAITLSRGREVTGTIQAVAATRNQVIPAAGATVRLFKVPLVKPSPGDTTTPPAPLAEAVADELGNYSVILPAR